MMTLDQILFRLCERNKLKDPVGSRVEKHKSVGGILKPNKDGYIKGRTADGKLVWKKIGGKSVARQLMDKEAAKKKENPDARTLK